MKSERITFGSHLDDYGITEKVFLHFVKDFFVVEGREILIQLFSLFKREGNSNFHFFHPIIKYIFQQIHILYLYGGVYKYIL